MLEKKLIRSGEGARITWNEPVGGWRGYRGHTLVVRVPNSRYNTFRISDAVTEGIQGQPQMTFENEGQAQEWLHNHPGFVNWRVSGTKRDYTCIKVPLQDGSECWLAESNFPSENSPEWNRLVELYPSYFRTGPGFFSEDWKTHELSKNEIEQICLSDELTDDEKCMKLWERPYSKVIKGANSLLYSAHPGDFGHLLPHQFPEGKTAHDLFEILDGINERYHNPGGYSVMWMGNDLNVKDAFGTYAHCTNPVTWRKYIGELIDEYEKFFGLNKQLGFFKESVINKNFSENEVREIMGDTNLSDQEKAHKLFDRDEDWVYFCGSIIYPLHSGPERERLEKWLDKPIPTCPENKDEYDLREQLDDLNEQLGVGPYTYFCKNSFADTPLHLTESYTHYVINDVEPAHTWWEFNKLCIETVEDFYGQRGFKKSLGFFNEGLLHPITSDTEIERIISDTSLSDNEISKKLFEGRPQEYVQKTGYGDSIYKYGYPTCDPCGVNTVFVKNSYSEHCMTLRESYTYYVSDRGRTPMEWYKSICGLIDWAERMYPDEFPRGNKKLGFFSESLQPKSLSDDEIRQIATDSSLNDNQKAKALFGRSDDYIHLAGACCMFICNYTSLGDSIYAILDRYPCESLNELAQKYKDGDRKERDEVENILRKIYWQLNAAHEVTASNYSILFGRDESDPLSIKTSFNRFGTSVPGQWYRTICNKINVLEENNIIKNRSLGFFKESKINKSFNDEQIKEIMLDESLTDDQKARKLFDREAEWTLLCGSIYYLLDRSSSWNQVKDKLPPLPDAPDGKTPRELINITREVAQNNNIGVCTYSVCSNEREPFTLTESFDYYIMGGKSKYSGSSFSLHKTPSTWFDFYKESIEAVEGFFEIDKGRRLGFFTESVNVNFAENDGDRILEIVNNNDLTDDQKCQKLWKRDWLHVKEAENLNYDNNHLDNVHSQLNHWSFLFNSSNLENGYNEWGNESPYLWWKGIKASVEYWEGKGKLTEPKSELGFFNESKNLTESYHVSPEVFKRVIIKYVKENGYIKGGWNGRYATTSPTVESINRILRDSDDLTEYMCNEDDYHGMEEWVNRTTPEGPQADWTRKCIDSWNKNGNLEVQDLKNLVAFTSLYINEIKYQQRQQARQERERQHQANVESETNTWAGEVGDTVEFTIQECKIAFWLQPRSYYADSYPCWVIKGTDGKTYTWNDTKQEVTLEPGMKIKGKIKKLTEFRGIKQTQVWRIEITSSHGTSLGFFTESFGYDFEDDEDILGNNYEVNIPSSAITQESEWNSLPDNEKATRLCRILGEVNSPANLNKILNLYSLNQLRTGNITNITPEEYEELEKAFIEDYSNKNLHERGLYYYRPTPEQVLKDAFMWDVKLGLPLIMYPRVSSDGYNWRGWYKPTLKKQLGFFTEGYAADTEPTSGELNGTWLKQHYGISDKELRNLCEINWERQDDNDFGMKNEKWGVNVVNIFFDDCGLDEFDSLDEAASFYGEQFIKDWIEGFTKHYKDDIEELKNHNKANLGFFSHV